MNDIDENVSNLKAHPDNAIKPKWIYVTGVASYFLFGAICAFIAFDNNLISPTDTPAERAAHTHELKVVLTSSFLGGGLLGAVFGIGGLWVLRKGSSSNRPADHEDSIS